MPTLLPPPTVVPRDPVITAEARLKVRLWRAPRRESIPFCRGDWSIARTPSTLFIPHPHPPSPVIPDPRHGNPSPGRAARAEPAEESSLLCVIPRPRAESGTSASGGSASGGRDLGLAHSPASSNRRAPCPSHYCGGQAESAPMACAEA